MITESSLINALTCHGVHDELDSQLARTHRQQVRELPLAIVCKS